MTVIGPVSDTYLPTHPSFSYTDHSGVTVTSARARFLRPLVFNDAYEHCAPGSRVRFRSDASKLTINLFFNNLNTTPAYNDVFMIYVDGVLYQEIDPTNNRTPHSYPVTLDFGTSVFRTIEVIFPYCAGVDFISVIQSPIFWMLPALPRPDIKMMCIGDSITHGFSAGGVGQSWPFLLAKGKNWELVNMGYGSSRTVNHMGGDSVATIQPDVITILTGHNDFGAQVPIDTFKTQYTTLLNNLLAGSSARIFAITPLWTNQNYGAITVAQYRTAITEVVAALASPRVFAINGLPLATNSTASFPDGIHPNNTGSSEVYGNLLGLVTV